MLVLLALLPPAVLTFVNARATRAENVEAARRELRRVTELATAQQQQLVDETRSVLMALADAPQISSGRWRDCRSYLTAALPDFALYDNLGVIDTTGLVRCSAIPTGGPVDVSDRTYFQNAMAWDDFATGTYQVGRITGRTSVNFGYPVFDPTGRATGVVFAALDVDWLNQFITGARLPGGATMTVFDLEGTVIARRPDPTELVGRNRAESELFRDALDGERITEAGGLDGVVRMYAFDTLDGAEGPIAYIAIGLPPRVLFADASGELRRDMAVLILVAITTLMAVWTTSSRVIVRPVDRLTSAADRLGKGDLDARVPEHGGARELSTLARSFNEMARSLSAGTSELEARLEDLRRSDTGRRRLLARLVDAQEAERRRIAEDIHDDSVQIMVAAALRLGALRLRVADPDERESLDNVEASVRQAIDRLRNLLFELSPGVLERDGIGAAVRRYAGEVFAGEDIVVRVEDLLSHEPGSEAQVVLYRTIQAALTNVRAHAHASTVRVELTQDEDGVTARVTDDGVGLDVADLGQRPEHLGIDAMRERVELAGGWMRIDGRPGHGTAVELFVPGAARGAASAAAPGTR
jgi:signal transduction histidine kinase